MLLILLGLILASLPVVFTTSLPHLVVVSIYAGLAHLLVLAWALVFIAMVSRRHRISEWRRAKKQRQLQQA